MRLMREWTSDLHSSDCTSQIQIYVPTDYYTGIMEFAIVRSIELHLLLVVYNL
jgi:hypothetical protein